MQLNKFHPLLASHAAIADYFVKLKWFKNVSAARIPEQAEEKSDIGSDGGGRTGEEKRDDATKLQLPRKERMLHWVELNFIKYVRFHCEIGCRVAISYPRLNLLIQFYKPQCFLPAVCFSKEINWHICCVKIFFSCYSTKCWANTKM